MYLPSSNAIRRSFRFRQAALVVTARRVAVATAIAAIALSAFVASPAVAVPAGAVTSVPVPRAAVSSVPSEAAPSPAAAPRERAETTTIVTSPATFTPMGQVNVTGTRQSGSSVVVTETSTGATCSAQAGRSTEWACEKPLLLPNGPDIELTAVETPSRSSSVTPVPGVTTIDVLGPPVLDGNGAYLTAGVVSGRGFDGAVVTVSVATARGAAPVVTCRDVVVRNTFWSCNIGMPSGSYFVGAQQSHPGIGDGSPSGASRVQQVVVDRDSPPQPVITSPRSGTQVLSQPVSAVGTGENGATVDVYIDNVPACSTTVVGTNWSCSLSGVKRGSHAVRAVQRDAVDNYAPPSEELQVFFGARASVTPAPSPTTPAEPGTPGVPAEPDAPDTPTEPGTPAPTPEPAPTPSAPAPLGERPIYPGPDGSAPTLAEALTNWGTPTGFGGSLGTFSSLGGAWYSAPILGLVFLALIALPLRLLVTALRGRVSLPHARFLGRNQMKQATADAELPTPPNAWLVAAVPLVAASALIVLATGMHGEVRYVRLLLAVGLGLVILNAVGGALAIRFGARWMGLASRLRFLPLMLLAAAISALVSRWGQIEPPLVVGVLAGAIFAANAPVRQRAVVNLIQVGAVTVLGLLGWIGHGLLGAVDGFWPSVASETLAALCMAGLGSALVLVLPIASLPGRVILEWSRSAWIGSVVVVASLAAAVIFAGSPDGPTLVPWIIAAVVFAALSLATWAFVRFVEPRLA